MDVSFEVMSAGLEVSYTNEFLESLTTKFGMEAERTSDPGFESTYCDVFKYFESFKNKSIKHPKPAFATRNALDTRILFASRVGQTAPQNCEARKKKAPASFSKNEIETGSTRQ